LSGLDGRPRSSWDSTRAKSGCCLIRLDEDLQSNGWKYSIPQKRSLHRAKAKFQNIALLVGTDADEQTVQYRYGRLAQALQHTDLEPRGANERIVLWVPRWNIETWIVHLLGRGVNEDTDYKYQVETDDFEPATNEYVRQYRAFDPATCAALPSLKNSFAETKRLEP
jgi:hypothetical protein